MNAARTGSKFQRRVLRVQMRHAYGQTRIYPINLVAKTFATIAGRVTLLKSDLELIEFLDYEIEWVPETPGAVDEST